MRLLKPRKLRRMILPSSSLPLLFLPFPPLPLFLPFWASKIDEVGEKPGFLMVLEAWASRILIMRDARDSSDDESLGLWVSGLLMMRDLKPKKVLS